MQKKFVGIIVLVLVAAGLVFRFVHFPKQGKVDGSAVVKPYTIGVSLSLTGPGAFIGESYKAGLELAREEINNSGGVAGRKLELEFVDNQNTPQGGVSAFQALSLHSPDVLVTTMSAASVPFSPLARDAGYPLVASAVFADILSDNQNAVSFFARSDDDARVSVEDMQNGEVKTVGVLYLNSEYGLASLASFEKVAKEAGLKVTVAEPFSSEVKDYSTSVTKVTALRPDAVYIIGVATTPVVEAVKQYTSTPIYTNLIPVFGGLPLKSPEVYEGVHVVAPAVALPESREYITWQSKLGEKKADVGLGYSATGYDVLYAIAKTLKDDPDVNNFVSTFTNLGGFEGINGSVQIAGRNVGIPLYPAVVVGGKLVRVEKVR